MPHPPGFTRTVPLFPYTPLFRSATGFFRRGDLSRDGDVQRPERFQVGQKVDAQVIGFDRSKKPNLSIKALQISEEKAAVKQYGSSDSGASLGDILGEEIGRAHV